MLKYKNVRFVDCSDWDSLVENTYQRPYTLQQQDDCNHSNGEVISLNIPDYRYDEDEGMNEQIEEVVNGNEYGVKFKVWLSRDPKEKLATKEKYDEFDNALFYDRNFYPNLQVVANDLFEKGLIEEGEYYIWINW